MLAGAGVAIGAAWSGLLGNFAAGAFMLVLRPFKVGDFVQHRRRHRHVHELGLFGTTIITPDNVMTIVGNGKVFGDTIQNFSVLPVRRVERVAQLAGSVDPLDAIARLKVAVAQIPNVAARPGARSQPARHQPGRPGDRVRPYTHTDHYWQVYFDTNEAIVRTCKEAGWPAPTNVLGLDVPIELAPRQAHFQSGNPGLRRAPGDAEQGRQCPLHGLAPREVPARKG
jgi:small conductance mechanosensitive channel